MVGVDPTRSVRKDLLEPMDASADLALECDRPRPVAATDAQKPGGAMRWNASVPNASFGHYGSNARGRTMQGACD